MRALITGGAGFVGSHLAEQLTRDGNNVTILDDFSTGRQQNLVFLAANPLVQIVRGSAENANAVETLVDRADCVFHLAATVGVRLVADEPVRTIRNTIHGTEVVLDAAHRAGKPILITSSSEVYGKGTRVPFSEDDDVTIGPTRHSRWCYAYSKGIDEFLGLAYHKQYQLPVVIVRLFNTVGPRQIGMYGMVLPRFVEAALENRPIEVYGDGKQTRCFCHVSDVVDAIVRLMQTPAAAGQVFNLGSDEEVTINELAERVIRLSGSKSELRHVPYEVAYGQRFDDLPRRVPDLRRIRSAIGFAPKLNLDQIISSVIADQREA